MSILNKKAVQDVPPARADVDKYNGLTAKDVFFKKLHKGRECHKFFDSGEYFSLKQGIKVSDLLPGGAPPNAFPPKREPTVAPQRKPSKLDQRAQMQQEELPKAFQYQVRCADY